MSASLELQPLGDLLRQEWLITGESDGSSIHGVEYGLERALAVAKGLALGGFRCSVRCVDQYQPDPLRVEVWAEGEL